jgi:hypothetical protein
MDDADREDEIRRREEAQAGTARVEPGGAEVPGRSIKQMVSVRLEAQLLRELRLMAGERGVSVSDLLREAAVDLLQRSRPVAQTFLSWRTIAPEKSFDGSLSAGSPTTSGIGLVENGESSSSGSQAVRIAS